MSNVMTAIYGGGPFYYGGDPVIDDLRQSGFTTVIMGIHLGQSGDIQIDIPLVQNGQYVGDPAWPSRLAGLKAEGSSVDRLLFCMGGWGVGDFPNIQELIRTQGVGPDSILYQNFKALKEAIPSLDGIDMDDETLYDQATTVAFSTMLGGLGYRVTFCPYGNQGFWTGCMKELEGSAPGVFAGMNLQCYAGGAGNTPGDWIAAISAAMGPDFPAASFVNPGLWCNNGTDCSDGDSPAQVQSAFASWRPTGITGGFIWLYDDIQKCGGPGGTAAYASAIANGLGAPALAAAPAAAPMPA